MRESKKQLIELLEPYMEKDLSDGCYILWHTNDFDLNLWDIYKYWEDSNWYFITDIINNIIEFQKECKDERKLGKYTIDKILGHYDITAVLRYIEDKLKKDKWYIKSFIFEKSIVFLRYNWKYIIPNKPLHLYTEEQEKDLLKLLKDLWKKN